MRIDKKAIIVAGDIDADCLAAWYAKDFWHMPVCTHAHLDDILKECQRQGINFIIPTRDEELLFWAEHRHHFEKHSIHVIVPSHESVMRCYDKLAFSRHGLANAQPVIPSFEQMDEIRAERLVVKERFGSSKTKTMLNLSREDAIQAATNCTQPIFQPYIAGREISADAWLNKHQRVKGIILRSRDKICDSEACVSTSFHDDELAQQLTVFLECLGLTGHVVTQLIIDENKNIHIIECNTRFGGASTLGIKAGLDSFYWSLREHIEGHVGAIPFTPATQPIRQLRIPCDHYFIPES